MNLKYEDAFEMSTNKMEKPMWYIFKVSCSLEYSNLLTYSLIIGCLSNVIYFLMLPSYLSKSWNMNFKLNVKIVTKFNGNIMSITVKTVGSQDVVESGHNF